MTIYPRPIHKEWKWKSLITCHIFIALLLVSFLHPVSRIFWMQINESVFHLTNNWIASSKFWQLFWALNNHRGADFVEDIVFITLFIYLIKNSPKKLKMRSTAQFLFCVLLCTLFIYFVISLLFRTYLKIPQPSPTHLWPESFRLSKAITWMKVKDSAIRSFPGDHAVTAFLLGGSFAFCAKGSKIKYVILYSIFLSLPRLMAGAHWFSDIFIGSLSLVVLLLSWVFLTPLNGICNEKIESVLLKLKNKGK
ncbi:MAG: phosphatase PAP2 family protein [Rhabdochlamydiaceae bacterium]